MRTTNKLSLLVGAAALTAALSGCNKEPGANNPNFNRETNEVIADFVFNVSTVSGPETRQSAANTQADPSQTFRGIENSHIYSLVQASDGQIVKANSATVGKDYDLSTIVSSGEISQDDSRRIIELSLPIGTNSLMFYGKAIKDGSSDEEGYIAFNPSATLSDASFALQPRLTQVSEFNQTESLIKKILTRIFNSGLYNGADTYTSGMTYQQYLGDAQVQNYQYAFWWPSRTDATEEEKSTMNNGDTKDISGVTNTLYKGNKFWYEYGEVSDKSTLVPLAESIATAYEKFTSISADEVRAGSAKSIERAIADLWTIVKKAVKATPTSPDEMIAQKMAERLDTRIGNYFTYNESTESATFKTVSDITTNLTTYMADPGSYSSVTGDMLTKFPTEFGLPMGSAQLLFMKDPGATTAEAQRYFTYNSTELNLGVNGANTSDISKIMYPAELTYFGNSPVNVSDQEHTKAQYPALVANWETETTGTAGINWTDDWDFNKHVLSTSRSVAMTNSIDYGSALLSTQVQYGAATLQDNRDAKFTGEGNKTITPSNTSFKLTGVLVGGQNNEMGWNFLAKSAGSSTQWDYVIFDNKVGSDGLSIPAYTSAGAPTDPNYTIVFDNYSFESTENDVFVALEFQNNSGEAFWGKENLIRNEGTFYLVGKLVPGDATNATSVKRPATLPPYNDSEVAASVFMQDYLTCAVFTIGETSLQNAYVTVPDLRSSQISLGLSVDIKWEEGLKFEIPL